MQNSKLLPTLLLLLFTTLLFSFQFQQNNQETSKLPFTQQGHGQWYKMDANAHISVPDFLQQYKKALGLSEFDEWVNYRTDADELGMVHYRYELFHKNILVDGSELLVHTKGDIVTHFNGRWVEGLEANTNVVLSSEQALARALEYVPSTKYLWEDATAEKLIKEVNHDPTATFYPSPELVLYNINFPGEGGDFQIAYKMIIQAYHPDTRKLVYVDAQSGDLIDKLELLEHTNTPAIAETKYHGTQMIFTDSIAPDSFRLYDSTRGMGVRTMDLNKNTEVDSIVEFWDADNYWNTLNTEQDEAALDAHFSAETTFDFFHDHLGHTGVDGDSMQLLSLVHYGNNVVNAFWNGNWCSLGDGDGGFDWSPLTSLDVVGHEFGHGITQNTANLRYRNESGALNESFSDIFGAAVEKWGEPDSADYYVGEDFNIDGNGFRNMANPNDNGDPDTYVGTNWEFGSFDNGGVHINSGVQNFWFYLLTEGGSGTNDNGFNYNVEGVGMDTSTMIAFRNLKYYLVRLSKYEDARLGARYAAEDLYGPCSFPAQQTVNAWRAVGVGELSDNNDFDLIRFLDIDSLNCGMSNAQFPTLQLRYNGCLTPLSANTEVPFEIQVDNGPIFRDTMTLTSDLLGGDTILFTYDTPVSGLETMGLHTLKAWVAFENDAAASNNAISFVLENIIEQNTDFSNTNFDKPLSDCFMDEVPVQVEVTFFGCDSIVGGSEIFFSFARDGSVITESTTINSTLYRDDSFLYTFTSPLEMNGILGNHNIEAWVAYPDDFIAVNDSLTLSLRNPKHMKFGSLITYEAPNELSLDSFYILTSEYSDGFLGSIAGFESDLGVVMTGKNGPEAFDADLIDIPFQDANVWEINEILSTKMCVCVNATNLTSVDLSFDLRQTYSFFFQNETDNDLPTSSSMRVLVNDQQVSPTYNPPATVHLAPWNHHTLDISDFAGEMLEVCFETRNFASPEVIAWGDRAFIDNVEISGIVGTEELNNNAIAFDIHPNPGTGNFVVTYDGIISGPALLELYDVHGRRLWSKTMEGPSKVDLDLVDFAEGVYYLRLDNGTTIISKALVIAK